MIIEPPSSPTRSPGIARSPVVGLIACLLVSLAAGCVTLKPVVVDRKTQLENQVLGTFQRLEDDLILASSVRGSAPPRSLSPLQREAVEAMMLRAFNKDDIDQLKQEQILGEANTGFLKLLKPPGETGKAAMVERLVTEENSSRKVILRRVVQLHRDLSDKDMPRIQRLLYRLNVEAAADGDMVQREAGDWQAVRRDLSAQPARKGPGGPGEAPRAAREDGK